MAHNKKPNAKAPLPFIGQKRQIIQHFRQTLEQIIPEQGQGWTIIDVFGGSGLLAHNAKHLKPQVTVIYNDFDHYSQRLQHIDDTNRLRMMIAELLQDTPRQKRVAEAIKQRIIETIQQFDGYIDTHSISTWLLFSGKQIANIDELSKHNFYNTIRLSAYDPAQSYLDGLEIVSQSYETLMPQYYDQDKTLFILDPPYMHTKQEAYGLDEYFGMVQFLKLMRWVRPPYIFFSSTKSELLGYMAYIQQYEAETWQRLGEFEKLSFKASINKNTQYEDNMIYKV